MALWRRHGALRSRQRRVPCHRHRLCREVEEGNAFAIDQRRTPRKLRPGGDLGDRCVHLFTRRKDVEYRHTPTSTHPGQQRIPHSSRRRCCTVGSWREGRALWHRCAEGPRRCGLSLLGYQRPTLHGATPASSDHGAAAPPGYSPSQGRSNDHLTAIAGSNQSHARSFSRDDIPGPREQGPSAEPSANSIESGGGHEDL